MRCVTQCIPDPRRMTFFSSARIWWCGGSVCLVYGGYKWELIRCRQTLWRHSLAPVQRVWISAIETQRSSIDRNDVAVTAALMCPWGCKRCRIGVAPLDVRLSVFTHRSAQTEERKVWKLAETDRLASSKTIQSQQEIKKPAELIRSGGWKL